MCGFKYDGDCRDFTPQIPNDYACREYDPDAGTYGRCRSVRAHSGGHDNCRKEYREVITAWVANN